MKNYNKELINALHSVFWYDGLLEQEDDEWVDFNGISRPKYKEDCIINKLIWELRNKKTTYNFYTLSDIDELCDDFVFPREFNVIWMMLVEMFGSCGTSPRTGWIERREECAEFLETVVQAEELYYEEVKEKKENAQHK